VPLSYVLVKNLIGPPGTPGAAGRTIYNSSGPPTASTGTLGDFYLDTSAYVLYGPKTSATAWPTAGQSLVGPPGPSTPQTIPSDLRLNSLTLAPVSGATAPEQIQVLDSSGNVKFLADAAGNITAAATALAASAQLSQLTSTNSQGQTNAVLRFPGVFGTGANANYPLSGIGSDSRGNLVFSYLGVPFLQTQNTGYQSNGAQAPAGYAFNTAFTSGSYSFSGGGSTLIQASASGIVLGPTTSTYSIPTTINTYAGIILQLQKNNSTVASFDTTGSGFFSGNNSVQGSTTTGSLSSGASSLGATTTTTLTTSGLATVANLTLASNGILTFADGTKMNTAATSTGASGGTSGSTAGATASGAATSHVGPFGSSAATGTQKGVNGAPWVFLPETNLTLTGATFFASAATAGNITLSVQSLPIGNGQGPSTTVASFASVTVSTQGSGFVQNLATPVTLTPQYIYIVSVAGTAVSLNGYLTINEPSTLTGPVTFADGTVQNTAYNGQNTNITSTSPTLSNYAPVFGALAVSTQLQTFSSTYTPLNLPGTSIPHQFIAQSGQAFYAAGLTVNSSGGSGALTFRLQGITDGATIFTSASIAKGTITGSTPATSAATYPLVAGNAYQWQAIGSGTANCSVAPQYYTPAAAPVSVQYWGPSVLTSGTLTSTYTALLVPGQGEASYYYNNLASYLYGATLQNAGTAAVTFQIGTYTSPSVPAGGTLNVGPFGPNVASFTAKTNYFWKVAGTGTANVGVTMQVVS
jgi:hypothetical protein